MSKPVAAQPEVNERSIYLRLGGIFLAVSLAMFMVAGPIIYPSNAHRELVVKQAKLAIDSFSKGADDTASIKELEALQKDPVAQHVQQANIVTTTVQAIISVAVVVYMYRTLRRLEIGERYARNAALVAATASAIAALIGEFIARYFSYPVLDPSKLIGMRIVEALMMAVVTFLVSWLIYYIVARITQWWMNRKLPESQRS